LIQLTEIKVRRSGFRLQGITLSIPEGQYGLVIGPSGAGKTTLLEVIAGHVRTDGGSVRLGGRDVTHLPPEKRAVGIVYQQPHLFPHLSVWGNIGYGLGAERDPRTRAERVGAVAESLGIAGLLDREVGTLSGGECQRVALGRALAPRPTVLLLDEPLAWLDPSLRRALRATLRQIHDQEGATILHVTHDMDDALRLGDVVAVLHEGRLVQQGPSEEVFRHPASPFVADFVGSGNVLAGTIRRGVSGDLPVFESGPLRLEVVTDRSGACHALIRAEEILVSRLEFPTPPRNHLVGGLARIESAGALAVLHLDLGVPLTAYVTSRTVEELGLVVGDPVHVAIKATAIHVM